MTDTRPQAPSNDSNLDFAAQVAHHFAVIRWEQAHPDIIAAEKAAEDAAIYAKYNGKPRPVEPVKPPGFDDGFENNDEWDQAPFRQAYWKAKRAYSEEIELWESANADIMQPERMAEQAESLRKDREFVALASDKKWMKANPGRAWKVKYARKRVKEADKIAAAAAERKAEKAARLAKGLAMARPSEDDWKAFEIWSEAHPGIVKAERAAETKAEDEAMAAKYPGYPVRPDGFDDLDCMDQEKHWEVLAAWEEANPELVAQHEAEEDAQWRKENPEEAVERDRTTLIAALGMLGSEHAGERAAAALQAERIRAKLGKQWSEIIR